MAELCIIFSSFGNDVIFLFGSTEINELFSSKVICQKFEKLYSIVTK